MTSVRFSQCTLIDPSSDEERLMDGFFSISMNRRKEICGIHMSGKLGLKREQIELCKTLAFKKVIELSDYIEQIVTDYYKYVQYLLFNLFLEFH